MSDAPDPDTTLDSMEDVLWLIVVEQRAQTKHLKNISLILTVWFLTGVLAFVFAVAGSW